MPFLYLLEKLRTPVLDTLFSMVTLLGEETVFMVIGMVIFWCVDKYKGYYLLFTGFVGTTVNQFLKMTFRIPRPWVRDPDFTIVESAREAAAGYSFPSGHTQTSVGMLGGMARCTKRTWLRVLFIAMAIAVAFSRMYLGVHTPADVLVSAAIALFLIFGCYPLFQKAKQSPKLMYGILLAYIALAVGYLCFVTFFPFPAGTDEHNLTAAVKNGYTLLGCGVGFLVVYFVDSRWIHFETKAVWWAQILKVAGGLVVVFAVKELLKMPLDALFAGHIAARAIRYFLIVTIGGILWPMTFRWFSILGQKKSCKITHI